MAYGDRLRDARAAVERDYLAAVEHELGGGMSATADPALAKVAAHRLLRLNGE